MRNVDAERRRSSATYQAIKVLNSQILDSSEEDYSSFDEDLGSDDDEEIAVARLIFQGQREVSIDSKRKLRIEMELQRMKEENLRSSVPYLASLKDGDKKDKVNDVVIDVYQPTTTPIRIATQVIITHFSHIVHFFSKIP